MSTGRIRAGRVSLTVAATLIVVLSGLVGTAVHTPPTVISTPATVRSAGHAEVATTALTAAQSSLKVIDGRPVASTPRWTNITAESTHFPAPRVSASMIYDSTDGYVVLFGGYLTTVGPYRYYNDTWTFSAGKWTNVTKPLAPSPRFGFLMADDPSDSAVVIFGGDGPHASRIAYNDTWEFHAGVWTNVTAGLSPSVRFWGSMSYDTAIGKVLLFGGNQYLSPTYSNDTWTFHAGVWAQLAPASVPSARDDQNQVDDVADHDVVMFGGYNTSNDLNDTWTYAGGTWTRVATATGVDLRAGPGLAYDTAENAVVMYGGYPASTYYASTWVLQAGVWSHYALSPTPDAGTQWGQMAYDAADQYVVLFQGDALYNSTWELNFTGGGPAPLTLTANAAPLSGAAPLQVSVSALAAGGTPPYSYSWTFGDTGTSTVENTSHSYATPGSYIVNLTVTDHAAVKVTKTWTVDVSPAPPPALTATITARPLSAQVNETVTFNSTVTGGSPPYTFQWDVNHFAFVTQNVTYRFPAVGTYLVYLTVHDSAEASANPNVTITVVAGSNNAPASSSNDLYYWLLLIVVVAIAILLIIVVARRRKRAPPPSAPVALPSDAAPGTIPGPPPP